MLLDIIKGHTPEEHDNATSQGGLNLWDRGYYRFPIEYIKDGQDVLNLGSGITFVFENKLNSVRKANIYACDILQPTEIPSFIKGFFQNSVEELFTLDKKFDFVTFFELIEHIDKTDILLKNCHNNLKDDGLLILACPNLSSFMARIELLLGFEPHVLEVSNEYPNFGTGPFGQANNASNTVLHHLRGFTTRALKELLEYQDFEIVKVIGFGEYLHLNKLFSLFPSLAPVNIFVCKKKSVGKS